MPPALLRALPADVWGSITLTALAAEGNTVQARVRLSSVCRTWRDCLRGACSLCRTLLSSVGSLMIACLAFAMQIQSSANPVCYDTFDDRCPVDALASFGGSGPRSNITPQCPIQRIPLSLPSQGICVLQTCLQR